MIYFWRSKKSLDSIVCTGVEQSKQVSRYSEQEYNASRQVRAGARKIMTAAERQAFLKDSEYGRMAGVAEK